MSSRRKRLTSPYRPVRVLPLFIGLLITLLIVLRTSQPTTRPAPSLPPSPVPPQQAPYDLPPRWANVIRAVDGDTLLLEGGERVRLFGVDTPETKIPGQAPEPFGPEASVFTQSIVGGKQIRLEFDQERFDKYGRTLAYVYVGDLFLNEELIRRGLSAAHLQYPFRNDMKRRFAEVERIARAQRLGIWSLKTDSLPPKKPIRYAQ